jgi:hypothetical protein
MVGGEAFKAALSDIAIGLLAREEVEPVLARRADPGSEEGRIF